MENAKIDEDFYMILKPINWSSRTKEKIVSTLNWLF